MFRQAAFTHQSKENSAPGTAIIAFAVARQKRTQLACCAVVEPTLSAYQLPFASQARRMTELPSPAATRFFASVVAYFRYCPEAPLPSHEVPSSAVGKRGIERIIVRPGA